MFIRWKKRMTTSKNWNANYRLVKTDEIDEDRTARTGETSYKYKKIPKTDDEKTLQIAYLCISMRVDGKPRQKTYYLASIRVGDKGRHLGAHIHFWAQALRNIERLSLDSHQQETIMERLSMQVGAPTKAMVEKEKQSMLAFWGGMSVRDEDYLLEKLPA